jgi:hypothetical protein
MSVADICLMASVLVVVAIVGKMIRAIRLLDGRVSLLQEQLKANRTGQAQTLSGKIATPKLPTRQTPIAGMPLLPIATTPRRTPPADDIPEDKRLPGEQAPHVIDEAEAEAVWAKMEAEQERMRKAMGPDFRARTRKRSATDIRGKPVVRAMSSQELARRVQPK